MDCTDGIPNSLKSNWNGRLAFGHPAARAVGEQSFFLDWDPATRLDHAPNTWQITSKIRSPRRIGMRCETKQASLFRGLIFAMLTGAFSTVVSVIVKQIKNLHPGQLALYRFIAIFVMCMPATAQTGQNPLGPPEFRFFLMVRGVFGGLAFFLNFIAFRYLSLGEASVIIFSSPVVVTIFARVFFKEPCSIFQSISVILTVVGIVFSTKLPTRFNEAPIAYSSEKIYGLLAAIFSLFCISAIQLITRKIRNVHHQHDIQFWLGGTFGDCFSDSSTWKFQVAALRHSKYLYFAAGIVLLQWRYDLGDGAPVRVCRTCVHRASCGGHKSGIRVADRCFPRSARFLRHHRCHFSLGFHFPHRPRQTAHQFGRQNIFMWKIQIHLISKECACISNQVE
ncbi:hypothetical protein AVEN_18065-1 [Araneus ventricosus]|uniref:EamA domain-containing protein n=1 Tax=Araneus ventricosus TaxID=182803 RepID=A0A4Y2TVJ4_ARAVE|nr:hypothetical protein AVEN_18065-1 [Araneus ventricosus]